MRSKQELLNEMDEVDECMPSFSKYTGLSISMGGGLDPKYNTSFASKQLAFALVLSEHELVKKIVNDYDPLDNEETVDDLLVDSKVLGNMKILDLGCGIEPAFARVSRHLGADTYTVDVISPYDFQYDKHFPADQRKLEVEKHIEVDLNDPDALETILNKSGGDFTLITSAHLTTGTSHRMDGYLKQFKHSGELKEFSLQLLKHFGIAYLCEPWSQEVIIKE